MIVLQDIRNWAATLPQWQQDALRRLGERKELTDTDIDELAQLAAAENGIPLAAGSTLMARPIALPPGAPEDHAEAVTLSELRDLQNINALVDEQVVSFPASGVTVIFGDNGSGKSGFGRLLRTICWARERPGQILGNIDTKDARPQKATAIYRIGQAVQPPFVWGPGSTSPDALGQIAVYDSDCGTVYLNDEQQSAYIPFGLDYFPRLALICDRVRAQITRDRDTSHAGLTPWTEVDANTEIGKQLAALPSKAGTCQRL